MEDKHRKVVYVITQGEYSDYGIICILDDLEQAQAYVAQFGGNIETWPVLSVPALPQGILPYSVRMTYEGVVSHVQTQPWSIDDPRTKFCFANMKGSLEPGTSKIIKEDTITMYVSCWAKSEEHAIKIANEVRAMAIESNRWAAGRWHSSRGHRTFYTKNFIIEDGLIVESERVWNQIASW